MVKAIYRELPGCQNLLDIVQLHDLGADARTSEPLAPSENCNVATIRCRRS